MSGRSEYQVEYCGMKGKGKGGGGSGEGGPQGLTPCKYNENVQPVGGRAQANYRQEMNTMREEILEATMGGTKARSAKSTAEGEEYLSLGKSVYVEDYSNEITLETEKQHAMQAQQKTVYEIPYAADIPGRRALYMYRSSEIKGPNMPFVPPVTMQLQQ